MSVVSTPMPTAAEELSDADPQVTIVYNTVYRPEYISAAIVSTLVSGCSLQNLPRGATPLPENTHGLAALPLYLLLFSMLIWLTRRYRHRFAPVSVILDVQRGPLLKKNEQCLRLRDVARLTESLARFYGRRVRRLEIDDGGQVLAVNEILFGYDRLKQLLVDLCPVSEVETSEAPTAAYACRRCWDIRQDNFLCSDDPIRFHSNTPLVVCLILLLIVDGLFNVIAQAWLIATNQPDLIVYLAPASLIVSALATRFGYYYMFTAVSLNPRKKADGRG